MHIHPQGRAVVHRIVTGCLCASAVAAPLGAQDLGMIEALFDDVRAVTVSYQTGRVLDSDAIDGGAMLRGAGTEVLINLRSTPRMSYEMGLGASYLRGYDATEPTLDLRATLRALPTISLYATRDRLLGPLSVYAGGTFGLVELWNAQAYGPSGQPWDVEARTFELGGSLGVYLDGGPLAGLFAEAAYRHRDFQSVRWTSAAGEELPAAWPRSLDFSGVVASLGWQLQLDREEEDADAPDAVPPSGTWRVERVDGAALPALLDPAAGGERTVLHGVLRLFPEGPDGDRGEWRMELNLRERGGPARVIESGTYTTRRDGVLELHEGAAGDAPREAERLDGRIYLQWRGHVLVLAPGRPLPAEEDDS